MICGNCRLERTTRTYAHHLGRGRSELCNDCHAALSKIGMSLTLVDGPTPRSAARPDLAGLSGDWSASRDGAARPPEAPARALRASRTAGPDSPLRVGGFPPPF